MAEAVSAAIEIAVPAEHPAAFKERLILRLEELTADLALGAVPRVAWRDPSAAHALRIGGTVVVPPLLGHIPAGSSRTVAEADAERVAAALIRHRWELLQPVLAAQRVAARPALREVAQGGVDLTALIELGAAAAGDDTLLGFLATERCPPVVELLLPRRALPAEDDRDFPRAAAEGLATGYGLPVPLPRLATDPGLDPGTFRLRVGRIRGRVQPETWEDGAAREVLLRRALLRHAPELFDIGSLLALLCDPSRVPGDVARAALARTDAPSLTWALRRLLAAGIGLVDPLLVCEAVTQPAVVLGNPGERTLALPGVLVLASDQSVSELERRLRARLVPAHLLRRAAAEDGGSGSLRVWSFGSRTREQLRKPDAPPAWALRLARAVASRIVGRDLLLVPADLGYTVRAVLANPLPDLLVVDARELPTRSARHRGTIEIGDDP